VDRLFALERSEPAILSISVIHGFMAADVPELGTRMLVVTDDRADLGDALAEKLGRELFAMRGTFMVRQVDEVFAVEQAMAATTGPVVIADVWDNPGGGTAGDATVILAELIARGVTDVAVGTIWDPIAVQICFAAGEGAEIALRFGAKSAPETGSPIDKRVVVRALVKDAQMRFGESFAPFGDAAWVSFDGIDVILNSTRAQSFDPSLFAALGIDPKSRKILLIKSTNHFYDSFSKIAAEIVYCSAGRPYPNTPATTDYRKARRTIWPMVENPWG
jgi:microcystin degradation protein MlrC